MKMKYHDASMMLYPCCESEKNSEHSDGKDYNIGRYGKNGHTSRDSEVKTIGNQKAADTGTSYRRPL